MPQATTSYQLLSCLQTERRAVRCTYTLVFEYYSDENIHAIRSYPTMGPRILTPYGYRPSVFDTSPR